MSRPIDRRQFMLASGAALLSASHAFATGDTPSQEVKFPYALHSDWVFPDLPHPANLSDQGPVHEVSLIVRGVTYRTPGIREKNPKTFPVHEVVRGGDPIEVKIFNDAELRLPIVNEQTSPPDFWKIVNRPKFHAVGFNGYLIDWYWERVLSHFGMTKSTHPVEKSSTISVGTSSTDTESSNATRAWASSLTTTVGGEVSAAFSGLGAALSASVEKAETNSGSHTDGYVHSETLSDMRSETHTVTFNPPTENGTWDYTSWQLVERIRMVRLCWASVNPFLIVNGHLPPNAAELAVFPKDRGGAYYTLINYRDIFQTSRAQRR